VYFKNLISINLTPIDKIKQNRKNNKVMIFERFTFIIARYLKYIVW
jgi:hypothetical protein